jgi:ABC-type polysaccharide/polyol phosphate transport system ATPase subunit
METGAAEGRSNEVLIRADKVSKKYCRALKRALWYGVRDIAAELLGTLGSDCRLRSGEFWALEDVSFEVRRGEVLGLIGENGAGKSTLLKLIHGLVKPDGGRVTVRGRVQALIELGAGFDPVLSGRENIYVSGAIFGLTKAQVDKLMPSIIEYSGLSEFLDAPVKSYSSGMRARLGFSVMAQLEADVILIDEVLAVGDLAFQEKCMRTVMALREQEKSVVFVTHTPYYIEALCDRALWLERGKTVMQGKASTVVRSYLEHEEQKALAEAEASGESFRGLAGGAAKAYIEKVDAEAQASGEEELTSSKVTDGEPLQIVDVELLDGNGEVRTAFPFLSDFVVRIYYRARRRLESPLFNIRIQSQKGGILEMGMLMDGPGPDAIEGEGRVECHVSDLPLTPGRYEVLLFVRNANGVVDLTTMRVVSRFQVTHEGVDRVPLRGPMALNHLRSGAAVYVPRRWTFYERGAVVAQIESSVRQSSPSEARPARDLSDPRAPG